MSGIVVAQKDLERVLGAILSLRSRLHRTHGNYAAASGPDGEKCYVCGDGIQEVVDAIRREFRPLSCSGSEACRASGTPQKGLTCNHCGLVMNLQRPAGQ